MVKRNKQEDMAGALELEGVGKDDPRLQQWLEEHRAATAASSASALGREACGSSSDARPILIIGASITVGERRPKAGDIRLNLPSWRSGQNHAPPPAPPRRPASSPGHWGLRRCWRRHPAAGFRPLRRGFDAAVARSCRPASPAVGQKTRGINALGAIRGTSINPIGVSTGRRSELLHGA
jgi:hypothetical protein